MSKKRKGTPASNQDDERFDSSKFSNASKREAAWDKRVAKQEAAMAKADKEAGTEIKKPVVKAKPVEEKAPSSEPRVVKDVVTATGTGTTVQRVDEKGNPVGDPVKKAATPTPMNEEQAKKLAETTKSTTVEEEAAPVQNKKIDPRPSQAVKTSLKNVISGDTKSPLDRATSPKRESALSNAVSRELVDPTPPIEPVVETQETVTAQEAPVTQRPGSALSNAVARAEEGRPASPIERHLIDQDITAQYVAQKPIARDEFQDRIVPDEEMQNLMRQIDAYNAQYGPQTYGEPAFEALRPQDYYPDLGQPIQVGTYQGSIVGSNPLFAAGGGLLPMGIYDARRRALSMAGSARAKQKQRILDMSTPQGAKQFQDQIDSNYWETVNKYANLVDNDLTVLTDPKHPLFFKFHKEMSDLKTFAAQTQEVNDRMQKYIDQEGNPAIHLPAKTKNQILAWMRADPSTNFEELMKSPNKFYKMYNGIVSYDNGINAMNSIASHIKSDEIPLMSNMDIEATLDSMSDKEVQDFYKKVNSGDVADVYSVAKRFVDKDRLKEIAGQAFKQYNFSDDFTEEDAVDYLLNLFGTEIKTRFQSQWTGRETLNYRKYRDAKEDKKQFFATTLKNNGNSAKEGLEKIYNTIKDPAQRAKAVARYLQQNGYGSSGLYGDGTYGENGEIITITKAPSGTRANKSIRPEGRGVKYDGQTFTSVGAAKNHAKAKLEKNGPSEMTQEDWFIIDMDPNSTFETSQSDIEGIYTVPTQGGNRVLTVYDDPALISEATPALRNIYNLSGEQEIVQRDRNGNVVKAYVDKEGNVVDASDEGAIETTVRSTQPLKISFYETVSGDDEAGIAVMDSDASSAKSSSAGTDLYDTKPQATQQESPDLDFDFDVD